MNNPPNSILIADDESALRRIMAYNLEKRGYNVISASNGREAIANLSKGVICALVDLKMPELDGMEVLKYVKENHPDIPVIMISAVGQIRDAVAALKEGALDYITKPFELEEMLALTASAARMGLALRENHQLRDAVSSPSAASEYVCESSAGKRVVEAILRIAKLDSTVLITGESGVGKGLVARMIHNASRRKDGPFITTSCPTLPSELLESEMFGHERGAFTGAFQSRIGRFAMANGGTLFLDEIGDLPLSLQPKLLNVIQDRQYNTLGGTEIITTDVRLIAATNCDLHEKVANKEFREDLFYRLNVIPIEIPPLRNRREDIPALCNAILHHIGRERKATARKVPKPTLELLMAYNWPGNIRELENVLERASAFASGNEILPEDLPQEISRPSIVINRGANSPPQVAGLSLDELEKLAIDQTLVLCSGNKSAAARRLGITEKSIYNKMTRLGLR